MSFKAGILNAYDWRNRGDRAIVETQMAWIRSKIPDVEFRVFSACWEENREAFGSGVSYPPPVGIARGAGKIGSITGPLHSWFSAKGGYTKGEAWREFESCDGYFLCGGGYLYSSRAPLISRQLWLHVANSLLALRGGKPVMQFPQSWGPFRKRADRWVCRKLAAQLPRVAARGGISAEAVVEFGYGEKTLNLPDVVLAMAVLGDRPYRTALDATRLGLGIAPIEFGFARNCSEADRTRYLDKLAEVASAFHANKKEPITLFVQVGVTGHDDDGPMAEMLGSLLRAKNIPFTIENGSDLKSYWETMGRQACFIGCRMHSCIFAMVASVPTIGLAYQPKFMELFRELGIADRCFDIGDFDSEVVSAKLLAPEFCTSGTRAELASAVERSANRTLAGLTVCWDAGGFPTIGRA